MALDHHNSLSAQYTNYVNSNNQVISTIRTTGNDNNSFIKAYATNTLTVDGTSIRAMILTIIDLFLTIGESINTNISQKWTKRRTF